MESEPHSRTCLIVEDSTFDQRMMVRVLARTERKIGAHIVDTLDDARRVLAHQPVELILLDNNLPDGKGANFALELSKHEDWQDIPVIIVSDWPSPFMFQKAKLAGVACVINKSDFRPETILAALPDPEVVH